MNVIFLMKSSTVDLDNYTIKNIQGSSKRLDVIVRCILSALIDKDQFHLNHQVLIFLDKYGGFGFDPKNLEYNTFPKNEIMLCDHLVNLIKGKEVENNPLRNLKRLKKGPIESIKELIDEGCDVYVLTEDGKTFDDYFNENSNKDNLLFIVGSQTGEFVSSEEVNSMKLKKVSLGAKSYLASQVIRLIKMKLG